MDSEKPIEQERREIVPWWTSCRLFLGFVSYFGTVSIYLLRANMSLGIVCMTSGDDNNTAMDNYGHKYFRFGYIEESFKEPNTFQEAVFDWSKPLQGWILSSFYFGYIWTQIPGGWLANKYGAKVILGTSVATLSILTFLTPIAAETNVYLLMFIQVLKGIASGFYYPAGYQMFGRWTTILDRTIIMSIFSVGSPSGSLLSSVLSGYLCEHGFAGGWPSIFYVFGIMGIIWCIFWYFLGYSSPQDHPRISEVELNYIKDNLSSKSNIKTLRVPWKHLLKTVPLYALVVVDLCYGWSWFIAVSSLPQYMHDVLGFNIEQNGFYSALPYLTNVVIAMSVSIFTNYLLTKQVLPSVTFTRKLFQSLAMIPGAIVAIGVAFLTEEQSGLAVGLLALWVGLMGCSRSGANPNAVEISPRYSGIIMGIDNAAGSVPGIIAPIVVGIMTENGTHAEWQNVFYLSAIIAIFGSVFFIIFADSEEQEWSKEENRLDTNKSGSTSDVCYINPAIAAHAETISSKL